MEDIERIVEGVYPAAALLAGMQLDLFTPLGERPYGAGELAKLLHVQQEQLETLLYALAAAGLLCVCDGRFANGEEADRRLVRGRSGFVGDKHLMWSHCFAAALQTAESVRSGRPAAQVDFSARDDSELAELLGGLHPGAKNVGRELAALLDIAERAEVLDVGGGSGGVALGILEVCPGIAVTVAELPEVVALTRRFIAGEGQAERVQVIECDLCEESPVGAFDMAVLKAFVQVLAVDMAKRALVHVYQALAPGGCVVIYGDMVDDSRVEPPEMALFSLFFLSAYESGRAYTESEYRLWLQEAGFVRVEALEQGVLLAHKEG